MRREGAGGGDPAALSARLEEQRRRGSRYFIGNQLSALDIYWATFCGIINPLPDDLCPMTPGFRMTYTNTDPAIAAAASPILYEHRDFIYKSIWNSRLTTNRVHKRPEP